MDEETPELMADGRMIEIDTGFYSITVRGDPEDELDDIRETAFSVASRARSDVKQLDDNFDDNDNRHYD